jgi:RND family efflux transporter MFP subunit
MSDTPIKTPSRRRLVLIGVLALALAIGIATEGLITRVRSAHATAQWTTQQMIPTVAFANLHQGAAPRALTLPGSIQPYNKASLYSRVNGYLTSWSKDIGAQVKAGEVLATIDAPDLDQQLAQAKATLASAKANYHISMITAGRNDALVKKQIVSQQAADQSTADADAKKAIMDADAANVRQLEAMQSFKQIVAPFDGVVTARNTDIGALITAGNAGPPLMEVSDLKRVRIYVHVPQAYLAQIQPGQKATFEMPQDPGRQFDATVVTMSKALDVTSRSMLVELQAENKDGKLFGGAYAKVHLQLPADPNVVRVPATALVSSNQGMQVAVIGNDNKVIFKRIEIGRDFGDSVEVISGLGPHDRVIDSPPETLQAGDTVQVASATQNAQANAGAPAPHQ